VGIAESREDKAQNPFVRTGLMGDR
jgi:hypothetical protein